MSETETETETEDEELEEMIVEAADIEGVEDIDIDEVTTAKVAYGESY
mgnify:CR=1 FL=1